MMIHSQFEIKKKITHSAKLWLILWAFKFNGLHSITSQVPILIILLYGQLLFLKH